MRLRRYSITASVPLATIAARGARKGFPSRLRHLRDRTTAPERVGDKWKVPAGRSAGDDKQPQQISATAADPGGPAAPALAQLRRSQEGEQQHPHGWRHTPEAGAQAQLGGHLQHVVVGQIQSGQIPQLHQAAGIHPAHLVVAKQDCLQGNDVIEDLGEGLEPAMGGKDS